MCMKYVSSKILIHCQNVKKETHYTNVAKKVTPNPYIQRL